MLSHKFLDSILNTILGVCVFSVTLLQHATVIHAIVFNGSVTVVIRLDQKYTLKLILRHHQLNKVKLTV